MDENSVFIVFNIVNKSGAMDYPNRMFGTKVNNTLDVC